MWDWHSLSLFYLLLKPEVVMLPWTLCYLGCDWLGEFSIYFPSFMSDVLYHRGSIVWNTSYVVICTFLKCYVIDLQRKPHISFLSYIRQLKFSSGSGAAYWWSGLKNFQGTLRSTKNFAGVQEGGTEFFYSFGAIFFGMAEGGNIFSGVQKGGGQDFFGCKMGWGEKKLTTASTIRCSPSL